MTRSSPASEISRLATRRTRRSSTACWSDAQRAMPEEGLEPRHADYDWSSLWLCGAVLPVGGTPKGTCPRGMCTVSSRTLVASRAVLVDPHLRAAPATVGRLRSLEASADRSDAQRIRRQLSCRERGQRNHPGWAGDRRDDELVEVVEHRAREKLP